MWLAWLIQSNAFLQSVKIVFFLVFFNFIRPLPCAGSAGVWQAEEVPPVSPHLMAALAGLGWVEGELAAAAGGRAAAGEVEAKSGQGQPCVCLA